MVFGPGHPSEPHGHFEEPGFPGPVPTPFERESLQVGPDAAVLKLPGDSSGQPGPRWLESSLLTLHGTGCPRSRSRVPLAEEISRAGDRSLHV